MRNVLIALVLVAAVGVGLSTAPPIPNPTVSAPVTGGTRGSAFGAWTTATTPAGYVEEERFFSGTATSYTKTGEWTVDGRWSAMPAATSAYKVRMLIRRPTDARRFNGIVVVEWLNVTAQSEGAADFMQMQEELIRSGYAWVGVGAQAVGVNSGTGLKAWDAARYGSLVHPGDAYSYDIYSQAAQAIRHPAAQDPLGGLQIRHVIATGRSQSAFRLVTYINAIHPLTHAFDGYFVHSRGANAAGLNAEAMTNDAQRIPPGAHIRGDIDVPVFDLQTEGDMMALGAHLTHEPPHAHYRRWEIAGAAHAETPRWVAEEPPALDRGQGCKVPVNSAPHDAVVKAGLVALTRWVRDGVVPPQSPAIERAADRAAADPIARDEFGNAKGGIRLPELEAPTATVDGSRNDVATPNPNGQNFCFLFGRTVPFDAARLASLYPSHQAFVDRFVRATDAIEKAGYMLKPEADLARQAARDSQVGR